MRDDRAAQFERDVVAQDHRLQLTELTARFEPELLQEHRPGYPILVQSVALPACPIEREHQLDPRALTKWMLRNECLKPRDCIDVAAQRQKRIEFLLVGSTTLFLE